MLSLRDTQRAFGAAIASDEAGAIGPLVREDGIPAGQRLQIYRNNHRLGALAALQATFPVIERLGGQDWFAQSVGGYLRTHPSPSGDLQDLGERYPRFLQAELADTAYDYFADVAALEWAYQCVSMAAERAPVDIDVLRTVAPDDYERLRFVLRPAVRLVSSRYPVLAIWRANQPSADESQGALSLDAGDSRVLLIRRRDHVELREIAEGTHALLGEFARGATLGPAASTACARVPDFDLEACLRELIRLEVIAQIDLDVSAETVRNVR
jgi:hypothetical protein